MPGLGNDLVVNLAGNNSKLKSKIAESKGGLSSFASAAKGMLNPVVAGLTAVAGGAIAAGVAVYGLTTRIAGLAQVADQATQTGLSGAFIQRLGYAADQSGVSVETLHKAIGKLTILSGQAQSGGKAAGGAFAALGLDAKSLGGMSPEQQFRKVAEAISKIPTAAGRASAAVSMFGKGGIATTALFAGGMNDLNKLLTEAESLGIGISDAGLAKAAAADDSIQRMKASFGALLDQLTVGVAPIFKLIADYITAWIPPITKFFDKFNELEDKVQFMNDLLVAGVDVGFEAIKLHWDDVLADMIEASRTAGLKMFSLLNPGTWGANAGLNAGLAKGVKPNGLAAAQQRLKDVVGMEGRRREQPQAKFGPEQPGGFAAGMLDSIRQKRSGGVAGLASSLAESATGLFGKASLAAQSKLTDLKIKGGFLGSVVENMFTGDKKKIDETKNVKQETRFAGAMQKGSAEAYSTIVQSMFRGKDPNVQATEKQTMQLVKAIKENKPKQPQFMPEFS